MKEILSNLKVWSHYISVNDCLLSVVEMYEAQLTDISFKPGIFLLVSVVNSCDQLEYERDLCRETSLPHVTLTIVWIPIEMTGFHLLNSAEQW